MTGSGFDGTAADGKIDLIAVADLVLRLTHDQPFPPEGGRGRLADVVVIPRRTCIASVFASQVDGRWAVSRRCDATMAYACCVETPFVMPLVAPRADVVAYDVVTGQDAARQATGKRGASGGRDGTEHGMV